MVSHSAYNIKSWAARALLSFSLLPVSSRFFRLFVARVDVIRDIVWQNIMNVS